jgi:hypothetical protein
MKTHATSERRAHGWTNQRNVTTLCNIKVPLYKIDNSRPLCTRCYNELQRLVGGEDPDERS